MPKGFTLIELLVVITLLGVLSAVGIPLYTGYADTASVNSVHNNLRAIHLQQQDYLSINNGYYSTGLACGDYAAAINTNLFNGNDLLKTDGWNYCITQTTPFDYTIRAEEQGGVRAYTLNESNVANF